MECLYSILTLYFFSLLILYLSSLHKVFSDYFLFHPFCFAGSIATITLFYFYLLSGHPLLKMLRQVFARHTLGLRVVRSCIPRTSVGGTCLIGARYYTPSERLKELYMSDFDKSQFPCDLVLSDAVLFAKFLYKAAESDNSMFDIILGDFRTIALSGPKLPVFWERTCKVSEIPEFSGLSEPVVFTLEWMQDNGMLDQLGDVADAFETYVNAKLNRVAVKIYTGADCSEKTLERAKEVAKELIRSKEDLNGFEPVYKVLLDSSVVDGFLLDIQGIFHNEATGKQVDTAVSGGVDYLTVPLPRLPRTTWKDNAETELLRGFLQKLAEYDMEEVKTGV